MVEEYWNQHYNSLITSNNKGDFYEHSWFIQKGTNGRI